jgi:predicted alpha/beta hydrolase family esterase
VLAAALSLPPLAVAFTALLASLSAPGLLAAISFTMARISVRGDGAVATSAREVLLALIREATAFAWATFVMIVEPYRRRREVEPGAGAAAARPVLLIHGTVCNGGIWRPLIERLAARGFAPVRTIDLEPLFGDLDSYAARVVQELRDLQQRGNGAPVAIVAHSMGGLVARAALRSLAPGTISRIVTIASPHHGTTIARLFRAFPTRQMRPESPWLSALNASQEGQLPIPVISIYSLHDNLIVPARSAVLEGARSHALRGLGHLSLLRARESLDCTLAALAGG